MTKRKLSYLDTGDYMGGKGNVGYLWNYLDYFEKKLEDEIVSYKEIDAPAHLYCPNFAAWLRIFTELICNKSLIELHRAEELQKEIKCYHFGSAVKKIIEITERIIATTRIKKNEFERLKKTIKMVVELRHTLQHGGIPNILRDIHFKNDVDEEDINKMMVPQNYKETKKIFYDANRLIELLPSPTFTVYKNGSVKFKKPENS